MIKNRLFITFILTLVSSQAMAIGALAIDSNQGSRYGYSHNYNSTAEARNRALSECGSGCSIVVDFDSGCAAYAADQAAGSSIYGWGTAPSRAEAENIALSQCEGHGGSNCIIRVWGCDSH